jgi:hypothetical protein
MALCYVTAGYRGNRGNATIEKLWEEVFFMHHALRLYNWGLSELAVSPKKEVLGLD